jgi:hypothetical protein
MRIKLNRYGAERKQRLSKSKQTKTLATTQVLWFFFFVVSCGGVTESTWHVSHCLAYCTSPPMIDDDECGGVGGMRTGRGNRSPPMIDDDESGGVGGMRTGRGNRSTRRKTAQRHVVHYKSHMT